jgi:hypothetical protein
MFALAELFSILMEDGLLLPPRYVSGWRRERGEREKEV